MNISIYGTAILSICLLVGVSAGTLLGRLVGVQSDIGGVGIAMLLLIGCTSWLQQSGYMKPPTESGILFWSSIYIPIVVAMAASQNVLKAMQGGAVAIVAGAAAVFVSFLLVGLLVRLGQADPSQRNEE